jgi:hypothetical protein
MAWYVEREAAFYEKEILKYPTGMEAVANLVIDATTVAANGDGRYVLEAGTVISKIAASSKVKPAPAAGLLTADVVGILSRTIEFFGNADASYDEPGSAFFHGAIFDTTQLVNYSANAANVKAALTTCLFQ